MFRVLEILEPMFQIGLPAASELLTHIRRHWVNNGGRSCAQTTTTTIKTTCTTPHRPRSYSPGNTHHEA